MHKESPYSFWTFVVLFTFIWIILFTTEPAFVKGPDGDLSKVLCGWYAFTIAIVIVLVFWFVFYVIRWRDVRDSMKIGPETVVVRSMSTGRSSKKGKSALEKLEAALM